ncbi:MAG: CBS domain-containing protein [Planctomycetes bacterium]|nr:CBS domain-containing protein [Planctomycetota bacterium]
MKVAKVMTREVITVAPDCPLDEAIRLFESCRFRHLPVVEKGRLLGMISDRDIALSTGWILQAYRQDSEGSGPSTVGQIMHEHVRSVGPNAPLSEAATIVLDHRVGAVPVVTDGELQGLVTTTDLLRACHAPSADSDWRVPEGMLVQDAMTRDVRTAGPDMLMEDAIDLCQHESVRHLPVVESGRIVGMVSDRDLRFGLGQEIISDMLAQEEGRLEVPQTPLSALMSMEVVTIGAHESLAKAAEQILQHGFSALPVVKDGKLVGILTNTDILRSCA